VGSGPSFVAAADLNGDGTPDLVVANAHSGTVSVLLNTKGTFGKAVSYPAGPNPSAVAVADFNGDGILDLAVANAGTGAISILYGSGGGIFQAPQTLAYGDPNESSPSAIAVADFNDDGFLDLAVTDSGNGTVTILFGSNGVSGLPPAVLSFGAIEPNSIVAADINGDGIPDLAVADSATGNIFVVLGTGGGMFGTAAAYPAGAAPQSLTFFGPSTVRAGALIVSNPASNMITALPVQSNGTLLGPIGYAAGSIPVSVVPFVTAAGVSAAVVDNGSASIMVIPEL